jgi:hypothetical protein
VSRKIKIWSGYVFCLTGIHSNRFFGVKEWSLYFFLNFTPLFLDSNTFHHFSNSKSENRTKKEKNYFVPVNPFSEVFSFEIKITLFWLNRLMKWNETIKKGSGFLIFQKNENTFHTLPLFTIFSHPILKKPTFLSSIPFFSILCYSTTKT